jgi:hypothetical protein
LSRFRRLIDHELDVDGPDERGAGVSMMRGEHRSWEQSYQPVRVAR